MGRSIRKKQQLTLFEKQPLSQEASPNLENLQTTSAGAINFSFTTLSIDNCILPMPSSIALDPFSNCVVQSFLDTLHNLSDCNYARIISSFRNDVKSFISKLIESVSVSPTIGVAVSSFDKSLSPHDISSVINRYMSILVYVYVHPQAFSIRKSMEWILELCHKMQRCRMIDGAQQTSVGLIIQQACIWIIDIQGPSFIRRMNEEFDVDEVMRWAQSLNCMALLGRDFMPWFVLEESLDDYLLKYIEILEEMIAHCVEKIFESVQRLSPESTTDEVGDHLSPGSAEIIRYSECCGEALRAVMNSLKLNDSNALPLELSPNFSAWKSVVDKLLQSTMAILKSNVLHKDIVTAAGMSLVCLQFIARFSKIDSETETDEKVITIQPGLQLYSILKLANYTIDNQFMDAYNDDERVIDEEIVVFSGLHPALHSQLTLLPLQSRCTVLRACLSVYDNESLLIDVSELPKYSSHNIRPAGMLLLGPFLDASISQCGHSYPVIRQCGLQMLESWINKIEAVLTSSSEPLLSTKILWRRLLDVSATLTKTWNHPTKQVSHMVPSVYQRLLSVMDVLSVKLSAEAKLNSSTVSVTFVWEPLVLEALSQPQQHRARYQALTLLLPKVTASYVLMIQPNLFSILIDALRLRDIASSAAALVVQLLRLLAEEKFKQLDVKESSEASKIQKEAILVSIRPQWDSALLHGLCSGDLKMRAHVADYLLKELLLVDPTSGPHLISVIHSNTNQKWKLDQKLWGLVNIVLQARLLTLLGKDIKVIPSFNGAALTEEKIDSHDSITDGDIYLGCISNDDELRLTTLTVLTASQKTAVPPSPEDLSMLKMALKYSLKCGKADHRQRVLRVIRNLLTRLFEMVRINTKDVFRLEKYLSSLPAAGSPEFSLIKFNQTEISIKLANAQTEIGKEYFAWLSNEVIDNMYPGTTFEREVISLEIIQCAMDVLSTIPPTLSPNDVTFKASSAVIAAAASILSAVFFTKDMTKSIINVALSSWDSSRSMASSILMRFPKPLPCYESPVQVNDLLEWGCNLAGSARQRESDAGAFLIKTVMTIYCLDLGWKLDESATRSHSKYNYIMFSTDAVASTSPTIDEKIQTGNSFLEKICAILDNRLVGLTTLFEGLNRSIVTAIQLNDTSDENGIGSDSKSCTELCHGLVSSLHLCLSEINAAGLLQKSGDSTNCPPLDYWRPLFKKVLGVTLKSLQTGMIVVAEAVSDVPFAPILTTKGPVNSSSFVMSASYMNTNSIVGSIDGASGGSEGGANVGDSSMGTSLDESSRSAQRAVVAAWLLVKESTALLATLVALSPPVSVIISSLTSLGSRTTKKATQQILSAEDVALVGNTVLEGLGRLKHMGAIAETHSALQSIASTLLRHGDRSPELCRLPYQWLNKILNRLNNEQQVFILRRSAGFAYSFLSLLRAEPANCKSTLLPVAMESLLGIIEKGIKTDSATLTAIAISTQLESTDNSWRLSVHALNVARLIILDAVLSNDLDEYLARATVLAMKGFKSPHWAVRNSSMMVFASIIQRAVANDKNGDSSIFSGRAVTVTEFFQRYPTLYPFLLSELTEISTEVDGVSSATNSSAMNTVNLHPSLYPILLLLSKQKSTLRSDDFLRDTTSNDTTTTSHSRSPDYSVFVTLIEKCSGKVFQSVRSMAAKALLPLVPIDQIPKKAIQLVNELISLTGPKSRNSLNHIHGKLFLVQEIVLNLTRHCIRAEDERQAIAFYVLLQQEVGVSLLPLVAELMSNVASYIPWCPAVHLIFFHTLCALHDFLSTRREAGQESSHIHDSRCLIVGECLLSLKTAIRSNNATPLPYEPVLWRETLHKLSSISLMDMLQSRLSRDERFATTLSVQTIDENPYSTPTIFQLLPLLNHSVSEAREGILLGLMENIDTVKSSVVAAAGQIGGDNDDHAEFLKVLLHLLLERISKEKEPPILDLTLDLFASLISVMDVRAIPPSLTAAVVNLWPIFYGMTAINSTTATIEQPLSIAQTSAAAHCIELLGWIIPAISSSEICDLQRVNQWIQVLENACSEDQDISLREATARSLLASRILVEENGAQSTHIDKSLLSVRAWIVGIQLMMDDDVDVRNSINHAIAFICGSELLSTNLWTDMPVLSLLKNCDIVFPAVVDFTIERLSLPVARKLAIASACNEDSSSNDDNSVPVIQLMLNCLDRAAGSFEEMERLCVIGKDGEALSEKIFEAEQANLYMEQIILAKLIHRTLAQCFQLVRLSSSESARDLLKILQEALLQRAKKSLDVLNLAQSHIRWIGGPTFQKDIFRFIYVGLNGLATLESLLSEKMIAPGHSAFDTPDPVTSSDLFVLFKEGLSDNTHSWIRDIVISRCSADTCL